MQTPALVVYVSCALLAFVSGTGGDAPAKTGQPDSLGQQLVKKQQECEKIISDTIEEELSKDNPHGEDFPLPSENYHNCKEDLDKLKRKYIDAEKIEKATYPKFFPVKVKEEAVEMLSVPAEIGAERKDLEFDVNEELCVTSKKCSEMQMNNQEKDMVKSAQKQIRCQILLEMIKHKFVKERKLDETEMKKQGGLSITCTGGVVLETLPKTMNNPDFNDADDLFMNDQPPTSMTIPMGNVADTDNHLAEHHVETHAPVKEGVPSKAFIDKANIISFGVVIVGIILT